LMPVNIIKKMPSYLITAIADGLKLFPEDRIQTFDGLNLRLSEIPELKNRTHQDMKKNIISYDHLKLKMGPIFKAFLITISIFIIIAVVIIFVYSSLDLP
jgi:hypothetical protein